MPIDGVVTRNIASELKSTLTGGKIDKVSQPETDEVILSIRNKNENFRLLLSASPNYPRVHLTNTNKRNPINAPMFCMVLRKHIISGKIINIEQFNLDRIIKIYIECYDDLGILSNKILTCEIMGRHSNIILIDEKSNTVVDSIKHITSDMSSFRQIMPGIAYKYPPKQDKINPLEFNCDDLMERISKNTQDLKTEKFIANNIEGISIFASREIINNAGIGSGFSILNLSGEKTDALMDSVKAFIQKIIDKSFEPCIYYDDSHATDFYSFRLRYLGNFKSDSYKSISETIEKFFYNKDKADRIKQKSADILRVVNNNLNRCLKKLSIQKEKLLQCSSKDKWKINADLIMSNLYSIKKGDNNIKALNYFDEKGSFIDIPLDIMLTPVQNAQKYYKIYNKYKNAEKAVKVQEEENLNEIEYFENQLINLQNCTEDDEIEEIRNELVSQGYIKKRKKTASRKRTQSKPLHFVSESGTDIYVGKNNVQNDFLTFKLSNPSDIWMHTKNIPGSHVIIRTSNKAVDQKVIIEAASLAAFYSKAKNSSNVPVDYTERKNVKKPSGAKPGMVIYYTNKTIYITPDDNVISNMKRIE
ncbi:MAG: NFACT RNA binding domain-containing protein [Clostridiales bacterium]|nr:NFACT RNA binding domain-containing protein [Clostridiales bacterium]HBM79830.1 fibronectin/fibrinogen-binding protein [Clostridiaceae bacterium]